MMGACDGKSGLTGSARDWRDTGSPRAAHEMVAHDITIAPRDRRDAAHEMVAHGD